MQTSVFTRQGFSANADTSPDKGMGGGVVGLDMRVDGGRQLSEAGEAAALQCVAREQTEPDFDLIEPGACT